MPMAMKFDRNNSEKRKSAREQFEAKRNKWVVKGKPKWTFCHTLLFGIGAMISLTFMSIVYNYITGAEEFP